MSAIELAAQEVWKVLGPGRCEHAYSAALAIELGGVHQFSIPIFYKGHCVSVSKADVLIRCHDGVVVIETKIADRITPEALLQAAAYGRSISATSVVVAFPRSNAETVLVSQCLNP